jgi:proteasome lid subunit RPN8/RPN11
MVDIKNYTKKEPDYASYPDNSVMKGNANDDPSFRIFIKDIVLNDIDSFLSTDTSKESGGVLLGNVYKDKYDRIFIVIRDLVFADFTVASVSRLTFTHNTWEKINKDIEAKHNDLIILGWFHSHPGHSVFLSAYDIFVQENYFNLPFMVAYVYDPTLDDRGFFCWNNHSLVKSESYYTFADSNTKLFLSDNKKGTASIVKKRKNNLLGIIISIFLLLNILFSGYLLLKYIQYDKEIKKSNELVSKMIDMKNDISNLNAKVESLIESPDSNISNYNNDFIKYQVKPGDTLKKIALMFYNDSEKLNLLIRFNNLKDEYDIATGQIILIPLKIN